MARRHLPDGDGPEADIRGRTVIDSDGAEVGTVDDLLIDEEEDRVRFLRIGSGGILGMGRRTTSWCPWTPSPSSAAIW